MTEVTVEKAPATPGLLKNIQGYLLGNKPPVFPELAPWSIQSISRDGLLPFCPLLETSVPGGLETAGRRVHSLF